MHKTEPEIRNKFGEKLDTWVETPEGKVSANVIMVHGFGTDKGGLQATLTTFQKH